MSNRSAHGHGPLWLIRRLNGSDCHLFSGSLHEAVAYINQLHRDCGMHHAARQIGP